MAYLEIEENQCEQLRLISASRYGVVNIIGVTIEISCIPLFKGRQDTQQIMLLVAEVCPEHGLSGELCL